MRLVARFAVATVALLLSAGVTVAASAGPAPQAQPAASPNTCGAAGLWNTAAGNWWALHDHLQTIGISLGAYWVMEGFRNFRGGKDTNDTVPASTLDLNLAVDTQKLLHLPGGTFYADLEDHAGRDPSAVLVGDLQIFDKLNYSSYLQVFELWYQQKFFDDTLRVKAGKVDANTEFSVITNGLSFVNSSSQVTPTLFVFPTTPDPSPGINLFFTPDNLFYASFGIYYANHSERFLDFTGRPYAVQPTPGGAFLIGESGLTWRRLPGLGTDGDLRLGLWGHTGTYGKFDGGTRHGVEGLYLIFDQTLWKPTSAKDDGRGLRTFLEYGYTDRSVSPIYQHFGGGVTWTGLLPGRPYDVIGFTPQYARLSPGLGVPHNYELALETFYNLRLTAQVALQPDLQYIVNPGGQYPDALVGTLRLKVGL